MRHLLAAGSLVALVALGACTDSGEPAQTQPPSIQPTATNTQEVCVGAATVQSEQMQQLSEEMAALESGGLPQEEYEQEAVDRLEAALAAWSDGLREQAVLAEDPELSAALTSLADGLADLAPRLTAETVRTGDIPGIEDLQAHTQSLTEICAAPTAPPTS